MIISRETGPREDQTIERILPCRRFVDQTTFQHCHLGVFAVNEKQ